MIDQSEDSGGAIRFVLVALGLLAAWGAYAVSSNAANGGENLPLGPVGSYNCQAAVGDVHANVPGAVSDAQREVDALVAANPELAPYAAEARQMLSDSAPEAHRAIDEAAADLGC